MFLFHDEADALDAKDFFIEQDRTTGAENLLKTFFGNSESAKWILWRITKLKMSEFFWSQMSLFHKVLDPPSYTRDLQRAKFQKSIFGHNF